MTEVEDDDDIVGADAEPAVVVRIRNAIDVIKSKGGAAADFAMAVAPNTVKAKMYEQIRDQLVAKFKEQGVDADVQVVATAPSGSTFTGEFFKGALLGGGALTLGWFIARWLRRR